MNDTLTCGFIGLGLIGGSIAKAFRKFYPDSRLIAYDIKQEALKEAAKEGVIGLPLSHIGSDFSECNYIFYVLRFLKMIKIYPGLKSTYLPPAFLRMWEV